MLCKRTEDYLQKQQRFVVAVETSFVYVFPDLRAFIDLSAHLPNFEDSEPESNNLKNSAAPPKLKGKGKAKGESTSTRIAANLHLLINHLSI